MVETGKSTFTDVVCTAPDRICYCPVASERRHRKLIFTYHCRGKGQGNVPGMEGFICFMLSFSHFAYRLFILRYNNVLEYDALADAVFMQVHSHRHVNAFRTAVRTASFGHKLPGTKERTSVQASRYVVYVFISGVRFSRHVPCCHGYPDGNVTYATFWA